MKNGKAVPEPIAFLNEFRLYVTFRPLSNEFRWWKEKVFWKVHLKTILGWTQASRIFMPIQHFRKTYFKYKVFCEICSKSLVWKIVTQQAVLATYKVNDLVTLNFLKRSRVSSDQKKTFSNFFPLSSFLQNYFETRNHGATFLFNFDIQSPLSVKWAIHTILVKGSVISRWTQVLLSYSYDLAFYLSQKTPVTLPH